MDVPPLKTWFEQCRTLPTANDCAVRNTACSRETIITVSTQPAEVDVVVSGRRPFCSPTAMRTNHEGYGAVQTNSCVAMSQGQKRQIEGEMPISKRLLKREVSPWNSPKDTRNLIDAIAFRKLGLTVTNFQSESFSNYIARLQSTHTIALRIPLSSSRMCGGGLASVRYVRTEMVTSYYYALDYALHCSGNESHLTLRIRE